MKVFSSVHGTPEQRYDNLVCMAYGYDAKEFAEVVDKHYLPESRAQDCYYEYRDKAYAFHKMIAPHMDMELTKKVLHTRWFTDGRHGAAAAGTLGGRARPQNEWLAPARGDPIGYACWP